ncbi:MAG: methyltransferase family protein [Thermoanaerobaculales bacterium]
MTHALRAAATVLIGIVIFVGLPVIAWGLGDLAGFLAEPARVGYVALVLLLNTIIGIRMPEVGKKRDTPRRIVPRQRVAVALLQALSLAIVIVAPYADRRGIAVLGGAEALRYVGLAMYALGLILMHWTQTYLGKQFSVQVAVQDGHRLVTDGPYRFLRHPRYLGIIVFSKGIALVFRSWLALIFVVAIACVLLWRIHDEEALMREEFGAAWDSYCRRSWRLVPFVY